MALNAKQRRFVDEYLIDLNATQAAIRAGYSAKTAGQIGERLLKKVEIQSLLAERMKAREKRTEITQDRVLAELAKIGFSDIRKVVQWGNTEVRVNVSGGEDGAQPEKMVEVYHGLCLKAADEIDDSTAAAIAEVSQGREGIKVKLHDKRAALVDIGRHLGMFKDKVEVTGKDGGPVQHTEITKEEFAHIAAKIASEV